MFDNVKNTPLLSERCLMFCRDSCLTSYFYVLQGQNQIYIYIYIYILYIYIGLRTGYYHSAKFCCSHLNRKIVITCNSNLFFVIVFLFSMKQLMMKQLTNLFWSNTSVGEHWLTSPTDQVILINSFFRSVCLILLHGTQKFNK